MLERLLPATVEVVESRRDIAEALFAEEETVVARAVEKRRREFTTARACARSALARLGFSPQAIPAGSKGAPRWPAGVVGSITHCDGYRACAVARDADFVTIGIDAETNAPLPAGVLADVTLPEERAMLGSLAEEEPGVCWDRLLFSAKESVYKAWFPLTERWLGFEDARISIDRPARTFSAQLLVPGPTVTGEELSGFAGRWTVEEGLALTAIALPKKA